MPGYLLDTNHITAWELQNQTLLAHLREEPVENIIWVCPISLGELECGFRITSDNAPDRRQECRVFIEQKVLSFVWEIGIETRDSYAHIMERIWRQHPPTGRGVETQQHLSALGVDVNDVWIASVAMERNLTLLTNDRMDTIKGCVPEITIDNWLE